MSARKRTVEQRFLAKVNKNGPTVHLDLGPCWLWTAFRGRNGYGRLSTRVDDRVHTVSAHRVSWELSNGAVPEGMQCLHHCDNRLCVNPGHLFLGTNTDNVIDKMRKGRQRRGERPAATQRWRRSGSVIVGVSRSRSKWGARLNCNGRQIYLGDYDSIISAALAYDRAIRDRFGSDAHVHFAVSKATETIVRASFRITTRSTQ